MREEIRSTARESQVLERNCDENEVKKVTSPTVTKGSVTGKSLGGWKFASLLLCAYQLSIFHRLILLKIQLRSTLKVINNLGIIVYKIRC